MVTRNANTVTRHSLPLWISETVVPALAASADDNPWLRQLVAERVGCARQRHVRGQVLDGRNRYREAGVEPTFEANVMVDQRLGEKAKVIEGVAEPIALPPPHKRRYKAKRIADAA